MALVSSTSDPIAALRAARLLPVVVLPNVECAVPLGRAVLAAGLRIIEITCRTSSAVPAIQQLRRECPELTVGAGTVLSAEQARDTIDAGAQFLVAPNFDEAVLQAARQRSVPMIPGVLTPTEVGLARSRGLSILKLFPAGAAGGPDYVRALSSVYGDVQFVPTGGVESANLRDYLALKSVIACGGSWLASESLLRDRCFDEIQTRVAAAVVAVRDSGAPTP